ncbi:MAG: hypothetical protein ISS33_02210 [Candidatus Omnitrophica bacterium]|nr:hypothetical protein [Candidatus Omnitrophota bacterium]
MDKKIKKTIRRYVSTLSIVSLILGQIMQQSFAYENLAASLVHDKHINPDRSIEGLEKIARTLEPNAIADGQALLDFAEGKLPQKIRIEDVSQPIVQSIREATELAIKLHILNKGKIPGKHHKRAKKTLENLISFYHCCNENLYLFKTDVRDREDYLLGFNREGLIGLDLKLAKTLSWISFKRLALYVYRENISEHIKIDGKTSQIDDSDYKIIYGEIASAVFDEKELEKLGGDFCRHINFTEACLSRIERKRFDPDKEKDMVKRFIFTIFEPDNKAEGIQPSENDELIPVSFGKRQTKNFLPRSHSNCGGVWMSYELNKEKFKLQSAPPILELLQTFIEYKIINQTNYNEVSVFFKKLLDRVQGLNAIEEDAAYLAIETLVEAWLITDKNYNKILDLIGKIIAEAGMFKRETFKNLKELASYIGTNAKGRYYFPNILEKLDIDYLISLIEKPEVKNLPPERVWIVFDFLHTLFSSKGITENNIGRIKEITVNATKKGEKDYIEIVKAYKAFSELSDEKTLCSLNLEDDTNEFMNGIEDDTLSPMAYVDVMKTLYKNHVPPESVSIWRNDQEKKDKNITTRKITADNAEKKKKASINSHTEIEFRAEIFKYNLLRRLQKEPKKIFAFAFDSDIGEDQKSCIMPVFTAMDQIKKMTDKGGHPLFPNLRVIRKKGASGELMRKLNELIDTGVLDKKRTFLVARKENIDTNKFKSLEGHSWIAAIDDTSNENDIYLPVFEALSLLIMSSLPTTDIDCIINFYYKISEKTEKELQKMIRNKLILVLPKAIHMPPQQLRTTYENVKDIYLAA